MIVKPDNADLYLIFYILFGLALWTIFTAYLFRSIERKLEEILKRFPQGTGDDKL